MFRPKPFVAMAAFAAVNLAAFAAIRTNNIYNADGVTVVGYKVSGLENNESALVFTNSSSTITWTTPRRLKDVQFLVVGGGGGGGSKTAGGGGGGGGVITGSVFSISSSAAIEVQVGGGGKGGVGDGITGAKGSDSKFKVGGVTYVTAYGGGYGAPRNKTGSSGGSGGGGEKGGGTATKGSADSNYVSYVKYGNSGHDGSWNYGGGGGGATAAGSSLTGGLGLSSFITGEECVYGSGGDGKETSGSGSSGAANSGDGGGGGGGGNGGSGGSGIVVLRYRDVLPGFQVIVR